MFMIPVFTLVAAMRGNLGYEAKFLGAQEEYEHSLSSSSLSLFPVPTPQRHSVFLLCAFMQVVRDDLFSLFLEYSDGLLKHRLMNMECQSSYVSERQGKSKQTLAT